MAAQLVEGAVYRFVHPWKGEFKARVNTNSQPGCVNVDVVEGVCHMRAVQDYNVGDTLELVWWSCTTVELQEGLVN